MTRGAPEDGPLLRDRAQDYHDYDTDNLIDQTSSRNKDSVGMVVR